MRRGMSEWERAMWAEREPSLAELLAERYPAPRVLRAEQRQGNKKGRAA